MEVWNGIWKKILVWNGIWKKILVWNGIRKKILAWNGTWSGRFLVWNGNGMEENCQYGIWKIVFHFIPYHALPLTTYTNATASHYMQNVHIVAKNVNFNIQDKALRLLLV